MQDISLSPMRPLVGEPTTLTFQPKGSKTVAGIEFRLRHASDGKVVVLGKTDAGGRITFEPALPGPGFVEAKLDGVDYVASIVVFESTSVLGFVVPWSLAALILLALAIASRRAARRDA